MRSRDQDESSPKRPYSVARLNSEARTLLEEGLGQVWLEAEVAEATRARSGHLYFKLSDPDQGGQVDAVMWRGQAMRHGTLVRKGARILCRGRVTVYERGGRYQLVVDSARDSGAGEKARRLARLKARLEEEGLFAVEGKRPIPRIPECVGVVTSRSGAAIRDIWRVASRRFPARILLAHASVQGDGAPDEIVAAMRTIASAPGVQVVILGRGGGSSEDLEAFDDERVVRAVAACPVPVISAVGHEVDVSLCDLAADRRAATPSEAAELAVPDAEEMARALSGQVRSLAAAMRSAVIGHRGAIASIDGRLRVADPRVRLRLGMETLARAREILARWPRANLAGRSADLERERARLIRWPDRALARAKGDLMAAGEGLYEWPERRMARARYDLGSLAGKLEALSPLASLARGYSVVRRRDDGGLVRSSGDAPAGTAIEVTLARGGITAEVTDTEDAE